MSCWKTHSYCVTAEFLNYGTHFVALFVRKSAALTCSKSRTVRTDHVFRYISSTPCNIRLVYSSARMSVILVKPGSYRSRNWFSLITSLSCRAGSLGHVWALYKYRVIIPRQSALPACNLVVPDLRLYKGGG